MTSRANGCLMKVRLGKKSMERLMLSVSSSRFCRACR